jgi:cytochrome c-type biogenesis protein CcmH
MKTRALILTAALTLCFAGAAIAVEPSEMLADPKLEARAREVSQALRCVVCQNQSIDDSNAEIAGDMRKLVRQRIMTGETNEQILNYMLGRYGDFVLLKPRFTAATFILWFGPLLVLVFGFFALKKRLRIGGVGPAPLTAEESATLAKLNDPGATRS